MVYDLILFGAYFKNRRIDTAFTIESLSEKSGISKKTIINIEMGRRCVRIETLSILSYYLKLNLLELLICCQREEEQELHKIINNFKNDLINYDYNSIDLYIKETDDFFVSRKIDTKSIVDQHFFDNVDIFLTWMYGVKESVSCISVERSESFFVHALKICNPTLDLEFISDYTLSNLEMHVLNSLIANRFRFNCTDGCQQLLEYLMEKIIVSKVVDKQLLLIVMYNLANLYLEVQSFDKLLKLIDEYEYHFNKTRITYLRTNFQLIYELVSVIMNPLKDKGQLDNLIKKYTSENEKRNYEITKERLINKFCLGPF